MSQNQKNLSSPPAMGDAAHATRSHFCGHSSQTLRQLILTAAQEVIADRSIRLEIDIPATVDCPLAPQTTSSLVRSLVRSSLECATDTRELLITVCSLDETFEIEVADDGPMLQQRPQRFPLAAAAAGAEVMWQDCPQGGVAVTAILTRNNRARLAA